MFYCIFQAEDHSDEATLVPNPELHSLLFGALNLKEDDFELHLNGGEGKHVESVSFPKPVANYTPICYNLQDLPRWMPKPRCHYARIGVLTFLLTKCHLHLDYHPLCLRQALNILLPFPHIISPSTLHILILPFYVFMSFQINNTPRPP